jgi:hypothetical protein
MINIEMNSWAYFLMVKQGNSHSRLPDQAANVKIRPDREVVQVFLYISGKRPVHNNFQPTSI